MAEQGRKVEKIVSQNSACYVGGILVISFIAPMVFIVLLLSWLGIGEYVFPIMIPIFAFIGAFILVFTAILAFAIRMSTRRRSELESSIARTYEAQMLADDGYDEPKSPGAVYIIPTYCPYCQAALDLHRSNWSSPMSLVCSSCGNHISVRISEDNPY